MAENASPSGSSEEQHRPCIKRVAIKTDSYEVHKDPIFTETLKGHPSEFYSFHISFFKPGSFDKQSYKTNNILKKFAAYGIYDKKEGKNVSKDTKGSKAPPDSKDWVVPENFPAFYEIVEEYNGHFNGTAKPFLIDAATWKVFMEPNSISEIKRQARIVLEDFKRKNTSARKTKESREGLHVETSDKQLEIVLTVSTKFLKPKVNNANYANANANAELMLELAYEFQKDGKDGKIAKIKLPIDWFLLYLEKEAAQFYQACSTGQVVAATQRPLPSITASPEEEVKTINKAKKRKLSSEAESEPKKHRRVSSSSSEDD